MLIPHPAPPYANGADPRQEAATPGTGSGFTSFEEQLPNHLQFPTFDGRYEAWEFYCFDIKLLS